MAPPPENGTRADRKMWRTIAETHAYVAFMPRVAKARALAELTDAELEARIKARLKEIEPALIDQWEGRPSD